MFHPFEYEMSTIITYLCIKYYACEQICDVIICCVWIYDTGEISVYDELVIEKLE